MRDESSKSLVSILLVAHNAASTIGLAVASLLCQTLKDWECHIVDDASTDATPILLSRLTDPRFHVHSAAQRLGRGGARNVALRHAAGRYLASLDADDFLFPGALQAQALALDGDFNLAACTGSLLLFSQESGPIGRRRTQILPGVYQLRSPLTTRLPLGSTMIRSSLVGSNRFREALRRTEDRDFYDRVLHGGRIRVLSEPTYAYRWGLSIENVLEGLRNREVLFRRRLFSNPVRVGAQIALNRLKRLFYPAFSNWGLWAAMNRLRAVPPTAEDVALFQETLQSLREVEVFSR